MKKENLAVKELNNMDEVENISIEKEDNSNDRFMSSGEFDFNGIHYYFFYMNSNPLVMFESSFIFTFEKFEIIDELSIYKSVDNFNDRNLALKASVFDISHEKKEVSIEFSTGLLLDSERVEKYQTIDIHPGVVILSRCGIKFSKVLFENGVQHDFLVENDDEEE